MHAGETTAHYVEEKAVGAKDFTSETGKIAIDYAGKTVVEAKARAAVAGWTAAHYSCEKAVEGTKMAARAVKGAAEYTDYVANELAVKPLSAAKDVVISTGESAKEYTARRKKKLRENWRL